MPVAISSQIESSILATQKADFHSFDTFLSTLLVFSPSLSCRDSTLSTSIWFFPTQIQVFSTVFGVYRLSQPTGNAQDS
jgi:hypothetical protein